MRFSGIPLFFGGLARFSIVGPCVLDVGVLVLLQPGPVVSQRFDNVIGSTINNRFEVLASHRPLDLLPIVPNLQVLPEHG